MREAGPSPPSPPLARAPPGGQSHPCASPSVRVTPRTGGPPKVLSSRSLGAHGGRSVETSSQEVTSQLRHPSSSSSSETLGEPLRQEKALNNYFVFCSCCLFPFRVPRREQASVSLCLQVLESDNDRFLAFVVTAAGGGCPRLGCWGAGGGGRELGLSPEGSIIP